MDGMPVPAPTMTPRHRSRGSEALDEDPAAVGANPEAARRAERLVTFSPDSKTLATCDGLGT
jgi:hypothetical protein